MAKTYTFEEVEAMIMDERKATIAAIRNIPYCEIGTICYDWTLTADAPSLQKYIKDKKAAELAEKEERGMNWVSLGIATEYTFPAGTYYIGDLCYVLDDEVYEEVVCYGQEGFQTNGVYTVGHFSTYGGDGCYIGTNERTYNVDAGIIGIVPAELIQKSIQGVETLTFKNEFIFGCTRDATFYVNDRINPENSFDIPTNDTDEGEDSDEDEDSE